MFSFIFTEILILLIILCLLLILSAVWPPDSPWAPWWQMPDDVIKKMCRIARISAKDTIYDLGCGTAKAIIHASSTYHAKSVGIEIDPVRFWIAKFNVWRARQTSLRVPLSGTKQSYIRSPRSLRSLAMTENLMNITLLKKDFFTVDFSPATVIFVYLVPNALKRLTPKFLKEVKSGTKFLSYVYPMPEELFRGKLRLLKHDTTMRIFYYQLFSKSKE